MAELIIVIEGKMIRQGLEDTQDEVRMNSYWVLRCYEIKIYFIFSEWDLRHLILSTLSTDSWYPYAMVSKGRVSTFPS